ncbi:MAG: gram-negative type outer rane porin protein [Ramlibacter sp.]|nr:gram-negative type outer rane porin protein [Ramlibacter sp.]
MRFNNTGAAVVALTLCGGVGAQQSAPQASVTLYGLADLAVEHLTNTAPGSGGLTRMPSIAGSIPSRLGFRGVEDLGNGLSANFVLEMGLAMDSGSFNQGGRPFGRQIFVGLAGPWGAMAAGRQNTMFSYAQAESDVMGPNLHTISTFDPYLSSARADNAITYRGTFGGLTVGASYSLGRDAQTCPGELPNDSKSCREWSGLIKYDASWGGVAVAVDEFRGAPTPVAGLTQNMTDKRISWGAYSRLNAATKIGAGLIQRTNEGSPVTPKSNLMYVGLTYQITPLLTGDLQASRFDLKNSANDGKLLIVRGTYALSKRTAVYASGSRVRNSGGATFSASAGQAGGNPGPGQGQTAMAVGIRHVF